MWIAGIIGQLTVKVVLSSQDIILNVIDSSANYRKLLLASQAIMASSIFLLGPLFYWYLVEKKPILHFLSGEQRYGRFIILTIGLLLTAMVVNTFFVYWNLQLKFPAWLAGFEHWSQAKEEELKRLTDLLTVFPSWKDLGIAIAVIGIIPAVGEEFVFRGILQHVLTRGTRNIHVAILMSACIFSALHLQIYGFLPRFLLGALFGYLYAWTQNLVYPIIAHFLNNSFTLVLLFIQQHTSHQFLEEQQLVPLPLLFTCTILGTVLAIHIYKKTSYLHNSLTS